MKRLLVFVFAVALMGSCENKNGIYKTYYENGSLKEYTEYKDGEKHGTCKSYFINKNFKYDSLLGQLKSISEFRNGSELFVKAYFGNGTSGSGPVDTIRSYTNYDLMMSEYDESSYNGCPYSIDYDKEGRYESLEGYSVIRGVKCLISVRLLYYENPPRYSMSFSSFNQKKEDLRIEEQAKGNTSFTIPAGMNSSTFIFDSTVYINENDFIGYKFHFNLDCLDSLNLDLQTSEAEKEEMEAIQEAEMSEIEEMEMRAKFDAEYDAEQQVIDD